MTVLTARLAPLAASTLVTRLESTVRRAKPTESRGATGQPAGLARQYADALVALAGPRADGSIEPTCEIIVHVRGDGCTMNDGTPVPDSVAKNIAPASFIRALIHDAEGRPINASGRQRHPTDRQKRVVRERDGHCVDCGGSTLLEYDHVPPYEVSGRTVVDELQMRCAMCHARRHGNDRYRRGTS